MWFPNRSDTNQAVQAQERARSLKFWSQLEEELYYPSSENKGADQLRGYREADLRLCFRLCRLLVFPCGGSIRQNILYQYKLMFCKCHHRTHITMFCDDQSFSYLSSHHSKQQRTLCCTVSLKKKKKKKKKKVQF